MIKNILLAVLVVGFILQLILIDAMFRVYKQLDNSNARMFTALVLVMEAFQKEQSCED